MRLHFVWVHINQRAELRTTKQILGSFFEKMKRITPVDQTVFADLTVTVETKHSGQRWAVLYHPLYCKAVKLTQHVEDHVPAMSCCFSNGKSWSWRRILRSASARDDFSSVISSSCVCRRSSITEARSGNSALLSADMSSTNTPEGRFTQKQLLLWKTNQD